MEKMIEKLRLSWTEPKEEKGKFVRTANPNQTFWSAWKSGKGELKQAGIKVLKTQYGWQVLCYSPVKNEPVKNEIEEVVLLKYPTLLLRYQQLHVLGLINAIARNNAALDASDTGTGKTYVACAVANELNRPLFIVCPKSVISTWERVAAYMESNLIAAINYEKLKTGKTKFMNKDLKFVLPENTLVVFDEVQKCKAHNTINSKMLIAVKEQGFSILTLSATIADSPLQMRAIGFVLNLFITLKDFWSWAFLHGAISEMIYIKGGERKKVITFNADNLSALEKIHNSIYPGKGSRMRIAELGDAFPETQIVAECYETGNSKKIQEIYAEMHNELADLMASSAWDKDHSHQLTIQLRARQKVELLKVPVFVEMAQLYIEEGHSVVIFVNFSETLNVIAEKLKTDCKIHGNQSRIKQDEIIKEFQSDKSRVIVCNIKAGGIGISLHDLNGQFPRVSIISPTFSAQDLVQSLGRIHRAGGLSKSLQRIIFAANTVEENVAFSVMEKIDRIKMLNDGDLISGLKLENIRFKNSCQMATEWVSN